MALLILGFFLFTGAFVYFVALIMFAPEPTGRYLGLAFVAMVSGMAGWILIAFNLGSLLDRFI